MSLQCRVGLLWMRWGMVAWMLFAPWALAARQETPVAPALAQRLAKLKQHYQAITSVRLQTTSILAIADSTEPRHGPVMRSACAYQIRGRNYRVDTKVDPRESKPSETIVAYDGARWQRFEQQASLLTYKKSDEKRQPACMPNPLLAPLAFIRPPTGENGVKLLWAEAQDEAFWSILDRDMQCVEAIDANEGLIARFRGQLDDGTPFTSHIRFANHPDYMPAQIDWVPEGKHAIRYLLGQYERVIINGQESFWPQQVRMQILSPKQQVLGELVTTIEELELNARIPADVFTLDFTRPETIFDDDMQVFVKTRGGFRISPSIVAVEGALKMDAENSSRSGPPPTVAEVDSAEPPSPNGFLADTRQVRLRWAGVFFSIVGIILMIACYRSQRAHSRETRQHQWTEGG